MVDCSEMGCPDDTVLDSVMATYHVRQVHHAVISAGRPVVWSSLQEVSLREMPVFRGLMTARELPAILLGRRWLTADVDRPILAQMTAVGFVVLAYEPHGEMVLGLLTRPWRPGGVGAAPPDAAAFWRFDAPGWVKAVVAFRLDDVDGRTRLVSETRVCATDAAALRRFRMYWRGIGWASGLTRRTWLAAVKRRAEAVKPE